MLFQLFVTFVLCRCVFCHTGSLCTFEDDEPVSLLQSGLSSSSSIALRKVSAMQEPLPTGSPPVSGFAPDDDLYAYLKCLAKDAVDTSIDITRKPVMWVHVHKAAGTAMCCEARRREQVVAPSSNCNRLAWPHEWNPRSEEEASEIAARQAVEDGKSGLEVVVVEAPVAGKAWFDMKRATQGKKAFDGFIGNGKAQAYGSEMRGHAPSWTTCTERAAYMKNYSFTWTAIERELVDGDVCRDTFMYGTILRRPLDTITSSLNFEGDNMAPTDDIIGCIQNKSCTPEDEDGGERWKILDNYIVRMLGGFDAMTAPAGGVNASHFNTAKEVLMGFDLVVLHDRLQDRRSIQAMDRTIGWHLPDEMRANSASETIPLSSHHSQQLRDINTLDYLLIDLVEETHYS